MEVPINFIVRDQIAVEFTGRCTEGCPYIEHLNAVAQSRLGSDEGLNVTTLSEITEEAACIAGISREVGCRGFSELRSSVSFEGDTVERYKIDRICNAHRHIVDALGSEYADMGRHSIRFSLPRPEEQLPKQT